MKPLLDFTETKKFTKKVVKLLSDEIYSRLQFHLCNDPQLGDIIQGSSGIRKLRWAIEDKGKRAGARVIYYWTVSDEKILMLEIYKKMKRRI